MQKNVQKLSEAVVKMMKYPIQLTPLQKQPVVSVYFGNTSLCMSVGGHTLLLYPLSSAEEPFGTPSPKRHKTSSGKCV